MGRQLDGHELDHEALGSTLAAANTDKAEQRNKPAAAGEIGTTHNRKMGISRGLAQLIPLSTDRMEVPRHTGTVSKKALHQAHQWVLRVSLRASI